MWPTSESPSTWLTPFSLPPPSLGPPKLFPVAFPYECPVLAHALDFRKIFQEGSRLLHSFHRGQQLASVYSAPLAKAVVAAGLGSQLGLAWAPPCPAHVAAIHRSLCSLCWVAPGRTQVAADLGLHHPGGLRASAPRGQLQTMPGYNPTTVTSNILKGWNGQAPKPH